MARRQWEPNRRAQVDRVARATVRVLDEDWKRVARYWARQQGRDVGGVLDMFDELASTYFYGGDSWPGAQARAWGDLAKILTPTGTVAA